LKLLRGFAFLAALFLLAGNGSPYAMAHHPVSTQNELAQQSFDQGLTLYYAYNGAEAAALFERAAQLDQHLAIAYYGIALAVGPDLNSPLTQDGFKRASSALKKAQSLEGYANESERAYVDALSQRYAHEFNKQAADENRYRSRMAELAARYPTDDDALILYTEALLEKNGRGDLWNSDGSPRNRDVTAMQQNLQIVLLRNPAHIGANHLMIHLLDSAPNAEAALASARRLTQSNFPPAAEHLAHMAAHTFIETGNYTAAATASREAIRLFDAYLASQHDSTHDNYWSHDVNIGVAALRMLGKYDEALEMSRRLDEHFGYYDASALTMVRFYRWKEALALHPSATSDVLRFARGMSYAATGHIGEAEQELQALKKAKSDTLSQDMLAAKIAIVRDEPSRAETLLLAAREQDAPLNAGEDPYFYPPEEALGALYFRLNQFDKAELAFRNDLRAHPHGGRALFGLWKTLAAQNKPQAGAVAREFESAWSQSDTNLDMSQL